EDAKGLSQSRRVPKQLQAELTSAAYPFEEALSAFHMRASHGKLVATEEIRRLSQLYWLAADWLEAKNVSLFQNSSENRLHITTHFAKKVLLEPARMYRLRAQDLTKLSPTQVDIANEYHRLLSLFRVELDSFER